MKIDYINSPSGFVAVKKLGKTLLLPAHQIDFLKVLKNGVYDYKPGVLNARYVTNIIDEVTIISCLNFELDINSLAFTLEEKDELIRFICNNK